MEKYSRKSSLDINDGFTNGYTFDICSLSGSTRASTACLCDDIVETIEEKKNRKRSHLVICLAMFFFSIGLCITVPGVFPYLKILEDDPQLSKKKIGWVTAANPLGVMICSPLMGYISSKLGSIRQISYYSVILYFIASTLYGCLPYCTDFWEHSAYHLMILSRLLTGLSSGILSVCRGYLATSSTIKERTKILSYQSASRSFGMIIGSVAQMVLILIISSEQAQYQATGYVTSVLAVLIFILFTPLFFKEFKTSTVAATTTEEAPSTSEEIKFPKPDYIGIFGLMFCNFAVTFTYVLMETILTPFVQDQYGWCDEMAVFVVAIMFAVAGVLFMANFILAAKLAKIFDERILLLIIGCGMTLVGLLLYFPYTGSDLCYCSDIDTEINSLGSCIPMKGHEMQQVASIQLFPHDQLSYGANEISNKSKMFDNFCSNVTDCLGCPPEQEWCLDVPQLPFPQFILAFLTVVSAFPFGIAMTITLLSKMVSPKVQGILMGVQASAGSTARISGPIAVSYLYSSYGTRYMDSMLIIIIIIATIEISCMYSRLTPMIPNTKTIDDNQIETERF